MEDYENGGLSPLVLIVVALVGVVAALVAVKRSRQGHEAALAKRLSGLDGARARARARGNSLARKAALGALIGALEHEAGRRALIGALKLLRSRL